MEKIIITPEKILQAVQHVSGNSLKALKADFYSKENADFDLLSYMKSNERLKNYTIKDVENNLHKIQFRVLRSRYAGGYWRLFLKENEPIYLGKMEDIKSEYEFRYRIANAIKEMAANCKIYEQGYRLTQAYKGIEKQSKEIIELKKNLMAARKGFKNFEAFKKHEKQTLLEKTAKEENITMPQASAFIKGGKRYSKIMLQLFAGQKIHPNGYTGRGKHISKGADHAYNIASILKEFSIKYESGNDAPKGGFSGEWIKLQ